MSLSEQQEALKKRMLAYREKIIGKEYVEYYERKENTKAVREKLIKLNHYNHVLDLMDDNNFDPDAANILYDLAKLKITKLTDKEEQKKEVIKMNLIGGHTAAWNIAHYYYERASKTLCQMMITFMDYIIQEQGGDSVIYEGLDKSKYFNLLDEIISLNDEYQENYFSICAFDFCTDKLGKYLDVPEYSMIDKEHDRIHINGNPQRVTNVMKRLKNICGEQRREVFIDIEKAYTPQPLYSEEIFNACYDKAIEQFGSEDAAMIDFSALVTRVNQIYQRNVRQ